MTLNCRHILQKAPLTESGNTRLKELFPIVSNDDLDDFREQVCGVVTTGGFPVDAALIENLPLLEVIVTRGVGFDHIDLDAAQKRGVVVSNTPGVLTDCVADLAFGALIAVSRRLVAADHFVRSRQWLHGKFPLTQKISGKRLGVVGMGRIGRALSRRARGFDMTVRYNSRTKKSDCPEGYEPSLLKLAEWSDFLVICAPGGAATQSLVSTAVLKALGSTGFLVNIARGSLVDEIALIQALRQGTIAGAALDVFAEEPQVPQDLIEMNNLVLLPHIGSSTRETFAAMEALLIDNLQSFFDDGKLLTPVAGG